jgi:hypothetical protein
LSSIVAHFDAAARPSKGKKPKPSEPVATEPTESPPPPHVYDMWHEPEWHWQQILATPRIGGRLTSVAVDRANPNRIFVGTEEGTLIRSVDGGVTWDERTLSPFVIQARSIGLAQVDSPDLSNTDRQPYNLPDFGDPQSASFEFSLSPPDSFSAADTAELMLIEPLTFTLYPPSFSHNFPPSPLDASPTSTLLQDAVQSRDDEQVPVNTIALCPGGPFPLMVATSREVYGSADDGVTAIRLFFITGNIKINRLACSPYFPKEVVVATDAGVYRSKDGGLSFNLVLTGWPGAVGTSVAFAKDPKTGKSVIYQSAEEELYGGDPDSDVGLDYKYPEQTVPTAPWKDIRSIVPTEDGEVWLGTDDGVRVSRDWGQTFSIVEPRLFNGQPIIQVVLGLSDDGQKRVAVLIDDALYASDDDGKTWFTFFHGLTARHYRQMAGGGLTPYGVARWYVVTNGELWTNAPPRPVAKGPADDRARRWARKLLLETPSMAETLDRVLENTKLSSDRIDDLVKLEKKRQLIPQIDLKMTVIQTSFARTESQMITGPFMVNEATSLNDVEILVLATWPTYDGLIYAEETSPTRNALYEMRNQVAFAAQDAWHEREADLRRIATGMNDPVQISILKARIESLDAILDNWGWRKKLPPIFERTTP